eukprot:TRINITY_DN15890_c0_g1_i2.p1 TRINITY_DN15890_c0_g1~~TRINITY_DN15890_c0_g1_i2.p1  ORF type:complete len:385 (+),score=91.74 TRINITY_DN15890_c0_g1_i2:112-1266(+)
MSKWKENVRNREDLVKLRGTFDMKDNTMFSVWTKRYFNLEGDKLFYYKSKTHLEHLGFVHLPYILGVKQRSDQNIKREWVVEITKDNITLYIDTVNSETMEKWIVGLQRWIYYFKEDWSQVNSSPARFEGDKLQFYLQNTPSGISEEKNKLSSRSLQKLPAPQSPSPQQQQPDAMRSPRTGYAGSPENELQSRVKMLEEYVSSQIRDIEDLASRCNELEEEHREKVEHLARLETRRLQYDQLINIKEEQLKKQKAEIESLQNMVTRSQSDESIANTNKIKQLEEKVNLLRQQNTSLLQLLDPTSKDQVLKFISQQEDLLSLQKENLKLKQQYFFALAVGIKMMYGVNLDINELYLKTVEEKVPMDQWDQWIMNGANNDGPSTGN